MTLWTQADGIMVARGDMGVQIELELVPVVQKQLIEKCNHAGKPVITASTQMLESMVESPQPTRAEVTDVANAIYDGSDAVMLSGETANGQHPDRAVEVMRKVALNTESNLSYNRILQDKAEYVEHQIDDAISYDASRIANQLDVDMMVAFTESGSTARRVSKYRPRPPILALTPHEAVCRKLTVSWGIYPAIAHSLNDVGELLREAEHQAVSSGAMTQGGKLVLTRVSHSESLAALTSCMSWRSPAGDAARATDDESARRIRYGAVISCSRFITL